MKKIYVIFFALLGSVVLIAIFVWVHYLGRDFVLQRQGNELIAKIEVYQKEHGEFPNSLTDMRLEEKEEGPLYYERDSTSTYRLWFGTGLGDSKMYYSDKKQWIDVY